MTSPDRRTLEQKVEEYLYRTAPEESNSKEISYVLKLNCASVRKVLSRMLAKKESVIQCLHRGFYSHRTTAEVVRKLVVGQRIELHGFKLEGQCRNLNTALSFATAAQKTYRKRGYYKETFKGRDVSITVHSMGLVEVFCSTSTVPMNYFDFRDLISWLKGMFAGTILDQDWMLSQVGLNLDSRQLILDDVKSIKLKVFEDAWFQMYQKAQDVLRIEAHLSPKLPLDVALSILRTLTETNPLGGGSPYQASSTDASDISYR